MVTNRRAVFDHMNWWIEKKIFKLVSSFKSMQGNIEKYPVLYTVGF